MQVVRFRVNDTDYVLDLSKQTAATLYSTLQPYIDAARTTPRTPVAELDPSEVRAWAQQNGLAVAHRGKIPFAILDAYNEAHGA